MLASTGIFFAGRFALAGKVEAFPRNSIRQDDDVAASFPGFFANTRPLGKISRVLRAFWWIRRGNAHLLRYAISVNNGTFRVGDGCKFAVNLGWLHRLRRHDRRNAGEPDQPCSASRKKHPPELLCNTCHCSLSFRRRRSTSPAQGKNVTRYVSLHAEKRNSARREDPSAQTCSSIDEIMGSNSTGAFMKSKPLMVSTARCTVGSMVGSTVMTNERPSLAMCGS